MDAWQARLQQAAEDSLARVVGEHDAENEAQARVAVALLAAFGDDENTRLYIEPCTVKSTHRPADLVLLDKTTGVLVVEVKGYSIDFIERVEAGSFQVRSDGFPKPVNPFKQAQNAMFDIRAAALRVVGDVPPLFGYVVALPNISEDEWHGRDFHLAVPTREILFGDHLESSRSLVRLLDDLTSERLERSHLPQPLGPEQARALRLVFGDTAVISEVRQARGVEEGKLGAVLDELSLGEKRLSDEQQELSLMKLAGSPRLVRGVAGSGKSVVLANQVARFIKRELARPQDLFDPAPRSPLRVGVVCFNRALAPFLERKIREADDQQTQRALPEGVLTVTHLNGLLYALSEQGYWRYLSYRQGTPAERAKRYRQQWNDPALLNAPLFDAVFIDEGQDLEGEEIALLHDLVKTDPGALERNLVVFYDDAQNLYARPRPNWRSLGIEVSGGRASVMKRCFRNTREIVELAYNALLGSAAPEDVRVQTRTYADTGYLKSAELVVEHPSHVEVSFATRRFTPPRVREFDTLAAEKAWVAAEVARLANDEAVRLEDVLVIFHEPEPYADLPEQIRLSGPRGLQGFVQPYYSGVSAHRDRFIFEPGHLTLSTTYGAKGYDAHVVFLVGADRFAASGDENKGRAAFYVGATRAKNVLYVTGVKQARHTLLQEVVALRHTFAGGVGVSA